MARLINGTTLFIHIAKTGGTFFREAINNFGVPNREIGEKHSSLQNILDLYKDMDVNEFPFEKAMCFIRMPHTWYRSRWAYGMMTYFTDKIRYMPEAQAHWMAKVWSTDLNKFVENTLKAHPNGIATEYFSKMTTHNRPDFPVSIMKYEHLIESTYRFIDSQVDYPLSVSEVRALKPQLESKHINQFIDIELTKEILKTEQIIYKNHYENVSI